MKPVTIGIISAVIVGGFAAGITVGRTPPPHIRDLPAAHPGSGQFSTVYAGMQSWCQPDGTAGGYTVTFNALMPAIIRTMHVDFYSTVTGRLIAADTPSIHPILVPGFQPPVTGRLTTTDPAVLDAPVPPVDPSLTVTPPPKVTTTITTSTSTSVKTGNTTTSITVTTSQPAQPPVPPPTLIQLPSGDPDRGGWTCAVTEWTWQH